MSQEESSCIKQVFNSDGSITYTIPHGCAIPRELGLCERTRMIPIKVSYSCYPGDKLIDSPYDAHRLLNDIEDLKKTMHNFEDFKVFIRKSIYTSKDLLKLKNGLLELGIRSQNIILSNNERDFILHDSPETLRLKFSNFHKNNINFSKN